MKRWFAPILAGVESVSSGLTKLNDVDVGRYLAVQRVLSGDGMADFAVSQLRHGTLTGSDFILRYD
jgi:hypothetical protein